MSHVTSKDGTRIAYERTGTGAASVVFVGGALIDPISGRGGRAELAPLASVLADHFTVYNYDRRGRAESGDTQPYALQREIEDLDAMIAEAGGGPVYVYGASSGGCLALQAVAAGLSVSKLAVYDLPFVTDDDGVRHYQQYLRDLDEALARGDRGRAVELFMRLAGSTDEMVEGARSSAMWPALIEIAHTLAYDAASMGDDGRPPTAMLQTITQPVLVASGGTSDWFERACDAVAEALPNAERVVVGGQQHLVDPQALAPLLVTFFNQ